jgi:alkanesulfonate monooxygenase SsuD/methylene tetrahydromethanopterin reductase-like flavin-dependent oxidoreductase (luciferase family)
MWDLLTSLAAAAAVTERIGLATTTLPLPNRNEVLVAKQAAVIDRLSAGRLTLGVSLGTRRFAQQMRSNSALRSHASHHAPALPRLCNALLREGLWLVQGWGSLDGMQGVRGSNPLSSTRHNAPPTHPRSVVCQQSASK